MSTFQTTDICLAAYLSATKHRLVSIEKTGIKGTFVFDTVSQQTVIDYDTGNASVEPQSLHNAIRQLTTAVRRI